MRNRRSVVGRAPLTCSSGLPCKVHRKTLGIQLYEVSHKRDVLDLSRWYARIVRYLDYLGFSFLLLTGLGGPLPALPLAGLCFTGSIAVVAWKGYVNRQARRRGCT